MLADILAGRVRPRLGMSLGTPFRRVRSRGVEVRWLCFGRWGPLLPWMLVALALAAVSAAVGAWISWAYAALSLVAGYGLLIVLSRRL